MNWYMWPLIVVVVVGVVAYSLYQWLFQKPPACTMKPDPLVVGCKATATWDLPGFAVEMLHKLEAQLEFLDAGGNTVTTLTLKASKDWSPSFTVPDNPSIVMVRARGVNCCPFYPKKYRATGPWATFTVKPKE